ncbi:MAG: hypothetical protein WBL65_01210 [Bryobacteraceae bacterium]
MRSQETTLGRDPDYSRWQAGVPSPSGTVLIPLDKQAREANWDNDVWYGVG